MKANRTITAVGPRLSEKSVRTLGKVLGKQLIPLQSSPPPTRLYTTPFHAKRVAWPQAFEREAFSYPPQYPPLTRTGEFAYYTPAPEQFRIKESGPEYYVGLQVPAEKPPLNSLWHQVAEGLVYQYVESEVPGDQNWALLDPQPEVRLVAVDFGDSSRLRVVGAIVSNVVADAEDLSEPKPAARKFTFKDLLEKSRKP